MKRLHIVKSDFHGYQHGFINIIKSTTKGIQAGLYNSTGDMSGLQVGFVNMAGTLMGLQIGLVNINKSGEPHKFLPIINYSF